MRSNMFNNLESNFRVMDDEQLIEVARNSFGLIMNSLSDIDEQVKVNIAILGAKLGVAADGAVNEKEKKLIDIIFKPGDDGSKEDVYAVVGERIVESDYNLVETLTQLGNPVAISFLHYILCFAYIDGAFEDEVAEKLDSIFGTTLLMNFIEGDAEENVPSEVVLTGIDAEIYNWFKENDDMWKLKQIQKHFPNYSKNDIEASLKRLCDRCIINATEIFDGVVYTLE